MQEMKNRPISSDQKETRSKILLAQGAVEGDTFMWSLVDLLTLLLIFFIFLYSQSSGQILSGPLDSQSLKGATPFSPVPLAFSAEKPPFTEPISISPRFISPLVVDNPPQAVQEISLPTPFEPTGVRLPLDSYKIKNKHQSIEQLREAALKAINESEDSACSIRWNQNRLVFVLGERITYREGESKLLKNFEPILRKISGLIASKKEYQVVVSGHTDDTPIDTMEFPSNWELSAARGIAVARLLIKNGVNPRRVSIQGFGEYRPLYENSTFENKKANRRVEIALVKEENREENSDFTY